MLICRRFRLVSQLPLLLSPTNSKSKCFVGSPKEFEGESSESVKLPQNISLSWISGEVPHSRKAVMAAVEATAKALESATISKTKELKGASTPRAPLLPDTY
jgi:hypothetical protein